jgi:4-diphosphocytidyl-2-C-methyl-D-erythritol kinase
MIDYCDKGLEAGELATVAANVGADVPFFLSGNLAATATGIGDVLTPIDLELSATVLLIKDPHIFVSTIEAYQSLSLTPKPIHDYSALFESTLSLEEMEAELRNDFEPSVFERYPRLADIKSSMYDLGAGFSLMTGSGSAIFGLFEREEDAHEASLSFDSEGFLTYVSSGRRS